MNLELRSFPNSRLLCLTRFWGEDLACALLEWKELTNAIPGVRVPSEEVLLYFFQPVGNEEFKKTPFWFSKKVIGFVAENEAFKIMDLDAGDCWESTEFEFDTYDHLERQVLKAFEVAKTFNWQVAPTWALILNEESLCQKARVRLFYENR